MPNEVTPLQLSIDTAVTQANPQLLDYITRRLCVDNVPRMRSWSKITTALAIQGKNVRGIVCNNNYVIFLVWPFSDVYILQSKSQSLYIGLAIGLFQFIV